MYLCKIGYKNIWHIKQNTQYNNINFYLQFIFLMNFYEFILHKYLCFNDLSKFILSVFFYKNLSSIPKYIYEISLLPVLSNPLPNIFNLSKKKKEKKTMQIEKPIEKHSRKFSIHIRNVASQDSIISRHNLF